MAAEHDRIELGESSRSAAAASAAGSPAPADGSGAHPAGADALAEMEDRWRRAMADLDNVRRRFDRELDRATAAERERVAAEWLPVLDNLELALDHAGADPAAILEGVRAVRDMAVAVLARLGFPRHDEVGVAFDPARHEALGTIRRDDVAPGTVLRVLRPGYGDGDALLRPAAVVVATGGGA